MAGKNVVERIIGSASERATARIDRARAELAKIEQQLDDRRQARDKALLDDVPLAVLGALRGEIEGMERERRYAAENLTAAERALALAEQAQADRALAGRWRKTRELCAAHAAEAEHVQRAVAELGAALTRLQDLAVEISSVVPAAPGLRPGEMIAPVELRNSWHEAMASNVQHQLFLATGGAFGAALAFYTAQEMIGRVPATGDLARRLHGRILSGERAATDKQAA